MANNNVEKKPQKKIGKYDLIGKIAQGGMGALYTAKHPTLDRVVLLKKLAIKGGPQFTERFKREARLMMDFKHDHIVQVYDHFKEGPYYYIVEEFVDGISLDALIRKERYLPADAAALILYEVCKALKYAHDKQVIHRDIKPANILISKQGEVKLVDFGIATSEKETDDGLTKDGMMLGTPAYVPPEQIEDAKNVDRRADIYSLGVVIYEMLTGKTPFPGTFTAETINLIHKGRYTAPKKLNRRASPLLCTISRKCMRVKPKRRYQDLAAVIKILGRRIKRKDPATIQRALKKVLAGQDIKDIFKKKRSWPARIIAAALVLGGLAGAGYYLYLQGYYYEYLKPNEYGALVVSANVNASYKDPEEIFLKPLIYRENGNTLTQVENIDFALHPGVSKNKDVFVIESKKIYLPEGRYRLKVNLEGQLSWTSFALSPRTVQKQLLATLESQKIVLKQGTGFPLPLQVRYSVKNSLTGADMSGSASLLIYLNGKWLAWGVPSTEGLTSGTTYKFRVEEEGFYSKDFSLIVKPYHSYLTLDVGLVPRSGTVNLRSTSDGITVLINDSKHYLAGGDPNEYKKLDLLGTQARPIRLNPGRYTFSFKRSGSAPKTISVAVESDKTVNVDISYDRTKNVLNATTNE
jgi:hypothetical protein